MGSIVDQHVAGRRGLDAEHFASEAFVHYNGPPLSKADGIVKTALDSYFTSEDGTQKPWHFTHKDKRERCAPSMKICLLL